MGYLEDVELQILRDAVDKSEERMKKRKVNGPEIEAIINIVEDFLRKKS